MSKIKSLPTLNSNIKTTFTETTKKNNKIKIMEMEDQNILQSGQKI